MFGLKKYISVTIIMLCIVAINTTDVRGCCECCCLCWCCYPKMKCSLCLKEKRFRIQRVADLVICNECNAIYPHTARFLDAPYLVPVRREESSGSVEVTVTTPLLSGFTHVSSPKPISYTDPDKAQRISRWLTDNGLPSLLGHFIREENELTRATLLRFIQLTYATIDNQREKERFAQTYMAGLHIIAHGDSLTVRTSRIPGRESGITQHVAAWNGELVDVLDRAFETRMKLLTRRYTAVHNSIWQAWTLGIIPETVDVALIITTITHDNAMGYPGFTNYEDAEAYRAMIPGHIVQTIRRAATREVICYIVRPPDN